MDRDFKPCEEAYKKTYLSIDERTTDDPSKIPANRFGKTWFDEGTNHRIEDGRIKRDFEREAYFIQINTLEDLIKFKDIRGELILSTAYDNPRINSIEIYDDYRE